jgi:hypothetical protein
MSKLSNHKRSGGPQTEEGKKYSSLNALKTGTYSSIVVLPGEDQRKFEELEEQFISDFAPQDIAEGAMVHELAVLTWKKLRLERLEHVALLRRIHDPIGNYKLADYGMSVPSNVEWILGSLEILDEAYAKDLISRRTYAQKLKLKQVSEADLLLCEKECPPLYEAIFDRYFELAGAEEATLSDVLSCILTIGHQQLGATNHILGLIIEESNDLEWVYDHLEKINEAIQKVHEERILSFMQMQKAQRAHDDLSRNFFRTLAELRKHQHWRLMQRAIDVTPNEIADQAGNKNSLE